jgi:hypothetical protein
MPGARIPWGANAVKRILFIAAITGALMSLVSAQPSEKDVMFYFGFEQRPKPSGLKTTLESGKATYFLGENIMLYHFVETTNADSFEISVGGDYRGRTRPDRFKVTAISEEGKPVADLPSLISPLGGGTLPYTGYVVHIDFPAPRVCDLLLNTAMTINKDLDVASDQIKSPEQALLYLARHGGGEGTLSNEEETKFVEISRHPLPYVRMKAIESLPKKIAF